MSKTTERNKRRESKRAQAREWVATDYVALKVAARLAGTYDHIKWHEVEALPLVTRWHKRNLIAYWVTSSKTGPWTQYPPNNWLSWSSRYGAGDGF
jgi:hypothetical protein